MANIQFTDAIGAATLSNQKPSPADRFSSWVPATIPYGESTTRQSDHATSMFVFGTDYGASFELTKIPVKTIGGVRAIDIAVRLIAWLLLGGTCTVNTGDADGNSYATCGIKPGTTPTLMLADKKNLEYTLSLSLINLAGAPVPMLCHYRA
jgi:hypothetical protein